MESSTSTVTAQRRTVKHAMPGLRFSHLSPFRQRLVRGCQAINYGHIERLEVKNSEPIFKPETLVYVDIKLDLDYCARSEVGLADFVLPDEILRLMAWLDEIQNGTIEKLEVRAGIPRRLVYSSPPSEVLR